MNFLKLLCNVLFLIFSVSQVAKSGNIHHTKGTWDILKPEYRAKLSPVCGAIGIEFQYIEKLYHFSNPDDSIVKLIKKLFHALPGGFMPSKQNLPSKFFSIGTVGSLLNILEQFNNTDDQTRGSALKKTLVTDPDFVQASDYANFKKFEAQAKTIDKQAFGKLKSQAISLIQKQNKTSVSGKTSLEELIIMLEELKDLQPKSEEMEIDSVAHQDQIQSSGSKRKRSEDESCLPQTKRQKTDSQSLGNIISQLKTHLEFEELSKKFKGHDYKNLDKNIDEFITLLLSACNECKLGQINFTYRPYTVQEALLAWIYKHAKTKADFVSFFEKLSDEFFIDKKVIFSDKWINDLYENHEQSEIHTKFTKEFNEKSDADIFNSFSGNIFGDVVFCEIKLQLYGQPIPVLPEFNDIFYEDIQFADCVETTIRNLCNILTYNTETTTFGNQVQDLSFSNQLTSFYSNIDNKTEDKTDTIPVRTSWSDFVQNLPNIAYARIKPLNDSWFIECPRELHGFIKLHGINLPENVDRKTITLSSKKEGNKITCEQITIDDKSYIIIPNNDEYHLFEIMPSVRNIIIIMNQFFNMDLFSDAGSLDRDFFTPKFGSTYFQKLCQKCHWTLDNDDVEKLDNEKKGTRNIINIKNKSYARFTLNIWPLEHTFAERSIGGVGIEKYQKSLKKYLDEQIDKNATKEVAILFDLYKSDNFCSSTPYRCFTKNLLLVSVNRSLAYDIIFLNSKSQAMVSLVSQIINHLEYTNDLMSQLIISQALSSNKSEFVVLNKNNKQLENAIVGMAKKIIDHNNVERKLDILRLLTKSLVLFNFQDLAINTFYKEIVSEDKDIRQNAQILFQELIENGQISELIKNNECFKKALDITYENSLSGDYAIRLKAISFLKDLVVNHNQGHEQAIKSACENISQTNVNIRNKTFELLEELFKKNYGFQKAIDHACVGVIFNYVVKDVYNNYIRLFEILFNHNQGFERAINIACEYSSSENYDHRCGALGLFVSLVDRNQCFDKAINAACTNIMVNNHKVSFNALELFAKLFSVKQGFNEATTVASENIISSDKTIRCNALRLFEILVSYDQCFDKAINAACTGIMISDSAACSFALSLFKKLFAKNRGFEEAINSAATNRLSNDLTIRQNAFNLFKELIEYDHGFKEAIDATSLNEEQNDTYTQFDTRFSILKKCLYKDYAPAYQIANNLLPRIYNYNTRKKIEKAIDEYRHRNNK